MINEEYEPTGYETALANAEDACFAFLNEILGLEEQVTSFVSCRARGVLDCMVFDIGELHTGDVTSFKAKNFHWRANAEFFCRDRRRLQAIQMRLLEKMPVAPQFEREHPLLKDSNVRHFRVAPETGAIGSISTQEIEAFQGGAKVPVFTFVAKFDVIFSAGERSAD